MKPRAPASKAENQRVIGWLLEENQPSVRYQTLVDILGRKEDDPDVKEARSKVAEVGWARSILRLQKPDGYWERKEPTTVRGWLRFLWFPEYRSTVWRAIVLSDLGLTSRDPRIGKIAGLFFKYKLQLGTPINIFNEEQCAVGNAARMMTRFGYGDDFRVKKLYDRLLEDQKEDGGWHCDVSSKAGTLDGWEALAALAAVPRQKRTRYMNRSVERGAEFYLQRKLFEEGNERYPPWLRFHYPNHYFYDVLVGLDLVTTLGYAGDGRLKPALELLRSKRRGDGTWLLDGVHPDVAPGANEDLLSRVKAKKFKPFALEEAGRPSKWVTLTALRVLKRVEDAS